jgi:transposase
MLALPETWPDSYDELRQITVSLLTAYRAQAAELKEKTLYNEALKFELARLKRWRFGASSERFDPNQLSLWQEDLEADLAAASVPASATGGADPAQPQKRRPKRQPLPEHLPRIEHRHALEDCTCGACGNTLTVIGEDISEQLDIIPAQFFIHRHIRPKYACRTCETVTAAPLPPQVIDKGLPAPGLLAQVLTAKYMDHQPLYRQAVIYARQGVFLPRSTQAGWVGHCEVVLEPLGLRLRELLLNEAYLQADETTVPVLAPGTGKTHTGYLWVYRSGPLGPLQAVVFDYADSRGKCWPTRFLEDFQGTLQVDGYAGYNEVLKRKDILEAGCWSHVRRKFFDVFKATRSPTAEEALRRIGQLYHIEAEAKGSGDSGSSEATPGEGCPPAARLQDLAGRYPAEIAAGFSPGRSHRLHPGALAGAARLPPGWIDPHRQ